MITSSVSSIDAITHLLWIDDDMTFAPDAARRLLAHDLPIVGGLCFGRRMPFPPTLIHITQRGFSFQYEYPEGLVEPDATGAAFLLVKKEVFYKIHEKFKEGPWTPIGVGEDVSFCRRARDVGYKIHVDTTVKIGHIAESVVDEDFAKRNRTFQVNPWYPPRPIPNGPPVASVIIPTWNQKPARLRAAVASALAQTVPVEVIIVDDGSDVPVTLEEFKGAPRLSLITLPENRGPWAALNVGIRAMTTDYFTWLSSDDLYYEPKIERQLAAMKENGSFASFHGYDVMLGDWGIAQTVIAPFKWKTFDEQKKILAHGCAINGLTVMLHRSVFDEVGTFDESYKIASDWDFWNRIAGRFMWLPIDAVMATRREYDNASQQYMQNPEKRALWASEDEKIRALYEVTP